MKLTFADFEFFGKCLEGFFYGTMRYHLFYTVIPQVTKRIRHYPISGLYSGIFVIYLQYHGSKKDANKGSFTIHFYALCLLYLLSVATIVSDLTLFLTQVS